jgi:hypothetical protein
VVARDAAGYASNATSSIDRSAELGIHSSEALHFFGGSLRVVFELPPNGLELPFRFSRSKQKSSTSLASSISMITSRNRNTRVCIVFRRGSHTSRRSICRHDLRVTHGTWLLQRRAGPCFAQRLGHELAVLLKVYEKWTKQSDESVAEKNRPHDEGNIDWANIGPKVAKTFDP